MRVEFINKIGEVEVDPMNRRGNHNGWLKRINYETDNIDYYSFSNIPKEASYYLTRYLIDLWEGKNLARGIKKGRRSVNHLFGSRLRNCRVLELLKEQGSTEFLKLTEDEVLQLFNNMRDGKILTKLGKPFRSVGSYVRIFAGFWHWLMRVKKKEGIIIPDIVENLDRRDTHKPQWNYLNLQKLEEMVKFAPSEYYRVLLYFLFDSGVRAPKELMNIRRKDLTEVPNSDLLYLQVREDTSKTFGRKIKLMISSTLVKEFMENKKLKPGDFLFTTSYVSTTRTIQKMGYKAFKIGYSRKVAGNRILVTQGITMYDFRHCSVCHYLPIYKSENQIKYRYGWKKTEMIHYYSEFLGMRDTICEEDMIIDTTKTELQQKLQKAEHKSEILEEQMNIQKQEMEEKLKRLETIMLQKFADNYPQNAT